MMNETKAIFGPADILIPKVQQMETWSVIACDQFSSDPEYWKRVRRNTEGVPTTLNLILPEAELRDVTDARIADINQTMKTYLNEGIFEKQEASYVYVERTLVDGQIRRGIIGAIDLEEYDYHKGAVSMIRATEETVTSRIPPRLRVRKDADIELPHVILLCDDEKQLLLQWLTEQKETFPKLYEFDLMEDGGHIAGWLVKGQAASAFSNGVSEYVNAQRERYESQGLKPMAFAVGDGNHSLATAKAYYETYRQEHPEAEKCCPARYALVELENIHDESQKFEPIHRILMNVDTENLLEALEKEYGSADGLPVEWRTKDRQGVIRLKDDGSHLTVAILQKFLDQYLKTNEGAIDYIHDNDALIKLTDQVNAIGFLLEPMEKKDLFPGVVAGGTLPRKTFSMGHACEKRYYLEARKIK